jgi:hypothetical protein
MSGTIAAALGAFSGVSNALAGPAVSLGGVGFQGMEVPERMPFGGSQRVAEHFLPGGGVIIDALGPKERDIEWSGYFTGTSAVSRALKIDAIRQTGSSVMLTWAGFSRKVIIKDFAPDYTRMGAVIPYKITCAVITGASAAKPGLLAQIAGDITSALGLDNLPAGVQSAVTAVQAALPIATLTAACPAALGVTSALGSAASAIGSMATTADASISAISTAAASSGQVFGGASGLLSAVSAQGAIAAAATAAAFVGRSIKNMASA